MSPRFPDINVVPALIPGAEHRHFCLTHKVAVSLLHSHHGVDELFHYAEEGRPLSRPPTAEDKAEGVPCSFYVNEAAAFEPYEWTVGAVNPMPSKAALAALLADLSDLSTATGAPMGFSLRAREAGAGADALVEVDLADKPGCHAYVPRSTLKIQSGTDTRDIITFYNLIPKPGVDALFSYDEVMEACTEQLIYCTSSCGSHHQQTSHSRTKDYDEVMEACIEQVIYCTSSCGVHHQQTSHSRTED